MVGAAARQGVGQGGGDAGGQWEAAINFANGGFRLSGMTWVDKVRIKKGPIEGEIGVEVGSSVTGEVQWMPPRRLMQRLQWQQDRWPTSLCKLTAGVKADLKLKMTGSPIMLSWQGNKPKLCVKAGVFSGVASAEGYIELEINPAGLNYVVTLFQDMLRQCHYERVTIYADDATYQRMSKLSQLALITGLSLGQLAAAGKDFIERVYNKLNQSTHAGLVAWSLSGHQLPNPNAANNPQLAGLNMARISPHEAKELEKKLAAWSTQLLPEALGSLLGLMVVKPTAFKAQDERVTLNDKQVYALQQLTISRLVSWLSEQEGSQLEQARHKFTEAVIRMHGVTVVDKVASYQRNLKELDAFMAIGADGKDLALKEWLAQYKRARGQLVNQSYEKATAIYVESNSDYPKIEPKGWNLFK